MVGLVISGCGPAVSDARWLVEGDSVGGNPHQLDSSRLGVSVEESLTSSLRGRESWTMGGKSFLSSTWTCDVDQWRQGGAGWKETLVGRSLDCAGGSGKLMSQPANIGRNSDGGPVQAVN